MSIFFRRIHEECIRLIGSIVIFLFVIFVKVIIVYYFIDNKYLAETHTIENRIFYICVFNPLTDQCKIRRKKYILTPKIQHVTCVRT